MAPPRAHPKSSKFAALSAAEKARRISKIDDPGKRAAAAKHWDVKLPGAKKWEPPKGRYSKPKTEREEGNIWERALEDFPKLGKAMYKEGSALAGGLKKDIEKGRGLPGAARYTAQRAPWLAPISGPLFAAEKAGLISAPPGPWEHKKLRPKVWDPEANEGRGGYIDERRSALDVFGEKSAKGIPGQLKMLADPMAWYNDPAIQLMNLGTIVIPGARVGGIAALSKSFKAANPHMTRAQANKAAVVDSFRPGLMRAHGVKGGLGPRVIRSKYGPEEGVRGRMPSQGPIGRTGQKLWDKGSEAIDRANPNAPFSASRRAAAASRRADERRTRQEAAARKQAIDEVVKGVTPTRRGRAKAALGLGGKQDQAAAAALVAMLEGPEGMGAVDAVTLKATAKQHILDQDDELRAKQDQIDDLQRQRDEAQAERDRAEEEAEIEGEEFDPTPHDEGLAALDADIRNRTDGLDFDLGRRVPEVVGSSVRASILGAMNKTIGKEKAAETIQAWDAWARGRNPDSPATAYAEVVESARVGKEEQFRPEADVVMYRRTPTPGTAVSQEQMGMYLPVLRALEGMKPEQKMQAGKVRSILEKAGVGPVEMRNANLQELFDRGGSLTREDVYEHIGGQQYARTYTPVVEIASDWNAGDRRPQGIEDPNFGPYTAPELNSRQGQPGEYHEATVSVPLFEGQGSPTSAGHFGDEKVIYHIRYQVFEDEDGFRVMLVDEIQSDWASDFRKAKKRGKHEREPGEDKRTPEEQKADAERLKAAKQEIREKEGDFHGASRQTMLAVRDGVDENSDRMKRLLDHERDLKQEIDSLKAEVQMLERRGGPSPELLQEEMRNLHEIRAEHYEDLEEARMKINEGRELRQLSIEDGESPEFIREIDEGIADWAREIQDMERHINLVNRDIRLLQSGRTQLQSRSPMGLDEKYLKNAVHTIMRIADDEDADKIVIVDGTTQAIRNDRGELGAEQGVTYPRGAGSEYVPEPGDPDYDPDMAEDYELGYTELHVQDEGDYDLYGEWLDADTREPLSNKRIYHILKEQAEAGELGEFPRLYDETIPNLFRKMYGVDPEHHEGAYTGRYSAQSGGGDFSAWEGYVQQTDSAMPGTVIHMSNEVKEKARADAPMYRKNLEGVAQGATEFLADGRARLTMFETANVSTWIHELAHVALNDLDPADLATIEKTLAEGRKKADWTEADNEAFARSFETYMRTGKAHPSLQEIFAKITKWMKRLWYEVGPEGEQISPETADVFDRMLGKRYQNTVLLSKAERAQVGAEIEDLKAALDDPEKYEAAAEALAKLAEEAEQAGIEIMRRNWKTPEQEAAGMEGLARRRNLVVEDYRRRGLVGVGEEARGYFPQMSMWEALGQPQVAPSRVAATGQTVGTPRVTSKAVNKNRNRLVRFQTGEVLNDPAAVLYILRARHRILATIRAREELYAVGETIEEAKAAPDWDPDQVAYVRNPDVTPETMHKATEAMAGLSREDFTRLQKRRMTEEADEIDGVNQVKDEMLWSPKSGTPKPEWIEGEDNVRVVPLRVAQNRVGDVFAAAPRGKLAATFGMLNALARAASIYLPLGGARYVARNWIQNAVLLAATQPGAFSKVFDPTWARRMRKEEPDLLNEIDEEVGTIQATALPEFNTRPQGKMQRVERDMNRVSGNIGGGLGRLADVPLRRASWRRHAEGYGFTSPADYRRLLHDEDLAEIKDIVAQRTREDMIDFDSLTPFEKEVLTRYLFIWPFIRGATKWPFMYAREYPGRLAAASLTANAINQEDSSGPISEQLKGVVAGRGFDFAWLNPMGPALENAQRLDEFVKRNARGEITLKPLITESLAPQYRFLLDALTGDLGNDPAQKMASTFAPLYTTAEAAAAGKDDFGEFLLKTFGNQTASRSIKREANEWIGEVDKIEEWVTEQGGSLDPATTAKLEKMKTAYADWTELSKRAEWAGAERGEDSLDKQKRAALILEIAVQHYPELHAQLDAEAKAGGWNDIEEVIAATDDDEFLDDVYETVRGQMFGLKEELKRDAKEAGYKE